MIFTIIYFRNIDYALILFYYLVVFNSIVLTTKNSYVAKNILPATTTFTRTVFNTLRKNFFTTWHVRANSGLLQFCNNGCNLEEKMKCMQRKHWKESAKSIADY